MEWKPQVKAIGWAAAAAERDKINGKAFGKCHGQIN